jgi:hypothetical protein
MTRHHRKRFGAASAAVNVCRRRAKRAVGRFKNAWSVLQSNRLGTAGFTLIEIAFACEVMMLLTLIGFNETRRVREYAKVAACLQYQASLQRSLWGQYALNGDFPDVLGPTLNQLPECSLGNDFDYKGGLTAGLFGEYYLRCGHDHSYVAVLFVDSGSYHSPKAIYNLASARGAIP